MEPMEIQNKQEGLEVLDKVKVEIPAEQKLKSAKVNDKKDSLDVSQAKHVETTDVMEDFKVDLESVKPEVIGVVSRAIDLRVAAPPILILLALQVQWFASFRFCCSWISFNWASC